MNSAPGGRNQMSNCPLRCVVAVSGDPQRADLMDALLADANRRDIVFVESIAHGYSRIKQLTPDIVVILLGDDDADACRLLSMLNMDRDTSDIRVVTWMTSHEETEFEDYFAQLNQDWSSPRVAIQMN